MEAGLGLEKAILSHAEHVAKLHPDLVLYLNLTSEGQSLPEPVRLGLFRIYQVAMSNVIHHARANWVENRGSVPRSCQNIALAK